MQGVYTFCNTGSVIVHEIDYGEDKVLASINGHNPEWYKMGFNDKWEDGFWMGEWFIPFSEVLVI